MTPRAVQIDVACWPDRVVVTYTYWIWPGYGDQIAGDGTWPAGWMKP